MSYCDLLDGEMFEGNRDDINTHNVVVSMNEGTIYYDFEILKERYPRIANVVYRNFINKKYSTDFKRIINISLV